MKTLRKFLVAALPMVVGMAALPANAGGLIAPFSLESTAVMPKGIRNFRVSGFSTHVTDKYEANGAIVPLAHDFNKPVTWNELIDSRPDEKVRGFLRGGLKSQGIDLEEPIGESHGLVNARVTSTVPVFAYGLTDRVTIGVGIPIVYSRTHVSTGWSISPKGQAQLDMLKMSGNGALIESYSQDLYNVVETKIASYGYKPLQGEEHTDIGDLTLALKVLAHKEGRWAFAVSPKLVIPTGREPDVDKVVDLAPGGGIWQSGLSGVVEFEASNRLSFVGSAGYTYQWGTEKAVRVPKSDSESISPDIDWNTYKKLGDIRSVSAGAKYRFTELLTGGVGYTLAYKDKDTYNGRQFASHRYRYLEEDTWQEMQSVLGSISLSTISLYRAGKFPVPGDVSFALSSVVDGRNVTKSTLAVFELAAYF